MNNRNCHIEKKLNDREIVELVDLLAIVDGFGLTPFC